VANPAHVRRIVPRPRRHALPRLKFEFERYLLLRFSFFVFFVVCVVRRVFFHLSRLFLNRRRLSSHQVRQVVFPRKKARAREEIEKNKPSCVTRARERRETDDREKRQREDEVEIF